METFTYFVPVDFTECCYDTLQYTAALARNSGGSVKLCHVVDLEEIPESDNPVVVSFAIDRHLQQAQKKMKSLREIILMAGISVEDEIVMGNIEIELIKQIECIRPSVIVIGKDSNKELTSHSLLTYLTRNTTLPVLVVPQSYNSKASSRAILTLDMDGTKAGGSSLFSELTERILSFFSVLEIRSLRFSIGKEGIDWTNTMRSNGCVNPNLLADSNNDRINQWLDFIRDNKIDLVCIREKRRIFNKFFNHNIAKHLPRQVESPLLVITL